MRRTSLLSRLAWTDLVTFFFSIATCWLLVTYNAYGGNLTGKPLDWSALNEMVRTVQLNANRVITDEEAKQLVLKGFMRQIDANSGYLTVQEEGKDHQARSGKYAGIGATIQQKDNQFLIAELAPRGPAARSGVKIGDVIFDVDGSLPPATQDALIDMLRGEAGSTVTVTFLRPSLKINRTYTVELVRAEVAVPSAFSERHGDVGLIRLSQFGEATPNELQAIFASLLDTPKPVKGIILDLRGNTGGLFVGGLEVASYFLPNISPLIRTFHRDEESNYYFVSLTGIGDAEAWQRIEKIQRGWPQLRKMPLVLLIDGESASASEIVAAAFKYNQRATLVGEKTFGKGTMQAMLPMRKTDGTIKLTIRDFRSADGEGIHGKGIAPDIEVKTQAGATRTYPMFSGRLYDPQQPDPVLKKAFESLWQTDWEDIYRASY
jgi:carboxyl-terminal processing protease